MDVSIFLPSGQKVEQSEVSGRVKIALPSGAYVVKVADTTRKVLVP